jgi:glycerol-3-phosphate acyltransferase PlsY
VLPYIVAGIVGYLLGSIPTAFLLVRWKSRLDIRTEGSGNVGTLNSYLVTKSRWVGLGVLVVDLLKGLLAVSLAPLFGAPDPFVARLVAGVGAVGGHNFPIWLGGKGGRGLATAAGVMLPLQAWSVLVWALGWLLGFLPFRKVNVANALATLVVIVAAVLLPAEVLRGVLPPGATVSGFRLLIILVMGVVMVRHIAPLRDYVRERRDKTGGSQR